MIKKIYGATSKWSVADMKKLQTHLGIVVEEIALMEREDLQMWNIFKRIPVNCRVIIGWAEKKV